MRRVLPWLVVLVLLTTAPRLARHNPETLHLEAALSPPSAAFPLGTDILGRCLLCRILHGAPLTLRLAAGAALASALLGGALGLWAGYRGGLPDGLLLALGDLALALPRFLLALVAAGLGGSSWVPLFMVLVLTEWAGYARLARSRVLVSREEPWFLAERALGLGPLRLALSLACDITPPLAGYALLRTARLVAVVAGLGFLGLGPPPPSPAWGNLLGEGRLFFQTAPWVVLAPAGALVLTLLFLEAAAGRPLEVS